MPYYISDSNPDCGGWAVEKSDGEVMGCHETKQEAIDQMVALSLAENLEPGGERAMPGTLKVGSFVSWNSSGGRARGQVKEIVEDGQINVPDSSVIVNGTPADPAALISIWEEVEGGYRETDTRVGHKFSTLTEIEPLPEAPAPEEETNSIEFRDVNLAPPAYMRAAARRGLAY